MRTSRYGEVFLQLNRGNLDLTTFKTPPRLELWAQAGTAYLHDLMRKMKEFVDVRTFWGRWGEGEEGGGGE